MFEQWPDLSLIGDGLAFYFRNQKQGAGPCAPASCVWGPSDTTGEHAGGCLAGACAEPTVANVGGEVADIRAWMPPAARSSWDSTPQGTPLSGRPRRGTYESSCR